MPPYLERVADEVLQARPQHGGIRAHDVHQAFDLDLHRRAGLFSPGLGDDILDERTQVDVHGNAVRPAGVERRKLQHPFNRLSEAARLGADDAAVALHARRVRDQPVFEVLRRQIDGRHRRAHLVRHGRHEVHLLSRQAFGAAGIRGDDRHRHTHQDQDAEADREVPRSKARDRRLE